MPKVTSKQHVRKKALREVHDLIAIVGSSQQDSGLLSPPAKSDSSQPSLSQSSARFLSHEQAVTVEGCVHGDPVGELEPIANLDEWGRPNESQSFAEQGLEGISPTSDEWVDEWVSVDSDDEPGDFRCADGGDSESQPTSFARSLAEWAVTHNITHKSLTSLLVLLKAHECFVELPKDARSLLKTPRVAAKKAGIVLLTPGSYCHYGLKEGLERVILNSQQCPEPIALSFNIDGLPLSKSTNKFLWPIQCLVHGCVGSCGPNPFVVGAFVGTSKPDSANEYLTPFVEELKDVINNGLPISGKAVCVELRHIICDAPARAFVFSVKGHTSYNGCPKCTAEADHGDKVHFTTTAGHPRTDQSVRAQTDMDHHKGTSVLTELPIDLVRCAPLDPMHLVYLGVTRKLVNLWLAAGGIGGALRDCISEHHCSLQKHIPDEFVRKPRSLKEKDRWKATEFRLLLHYTGPVVLQCMPERMYLNFLTLHAAVSILSTRALCEMYADYANRLLAHFVKEFAELYGDTAVSYNVHCLLHLAADAEQNGTLDSFSAFPFENNMQAIKKLIRKPGCPLSQIYNRMAEINLHVKSSGGSCRESYELLGSHEGRGLPLQCVPPEYSELRFQSFALSLKQGNNCCKVNEDIVLIDSFAHRKEDGLPCIVGRQFLKLEPLYQHPFDSTRLGIAVVGKLSSTKCWVIEAVKKLVILPYKQKFVVIPMLHTS